MLLCSCLVCRAICAPQFILEFADKNGKYGTPGSDPVGLLVADLEANIRHFRLTTLAGDTDAQEEIVQMAMEFAKKHGQNMLDIICDDVKQIAEQMRLVALADDGMAHIPVTMYKTVVLALLAFFVSLGMYLKWEKIRGGIQFQWIGYWIALEGYRIGISLKRKE